MPLLPHKIIPSESRRRRKQDKHAGVKLLLRKHPASPALGYHGQRSEEQTEGNIDSKRILEIVAF